MTTILSSERTPLDAILSQVGAGLSQTLPQAVQRYGERQYGMSALDQAQRELANANGDPSKIALAYSRLAMASPEAARAIGPIAQVAIPAAQKEAALSPLLQTIGGKAGNLANIGAQQIGQPQPVPQETQPTQIQPKEGKGLFLSDFVPMDIGELITPEQKTKILDQVAKSKGDVQFARQSIDDYNQGKIGFNELINANVEKQAANVQRNLAFEDQIKDRINKYIPQDTPESEKNIYYKMLKPVLEDKNTKGFSDAWDKVSSKIDNFRKLNEAYVNRIPEPQITGISEQGEKQLRNSAKPIMDVDPLAYNMLEAAYTQKGHSPITPAKILKPNPKSIDSILNKAGDYRELIYPKTGFFSTGFNEKNMLVNIEEAENKQSQEIPKIANSLRKNWNEDLSLLNIYTDLKKKGWMLPNINSLLDDVADLFSPRQQADRAMLNKDIKIPIKYLMD